VGGGERKKKKRGGAEKEKHFSKRKELPGASINLKFLFISCRTEKKRGWEEREKPRGTQKSARFFTIFIM